MSDTSIEELRRQKEVLMKQQAEIVERETLEREVAQLKKQLKPKNKFVKALGVVGKGLKAMDAAVVKAMPVEDKKTKKRTK